MIEVAPNLFVGNMLDYEKHVKGKDWFVLQACKEPYHRQALGYKDRAAPRQDTEYLFAYRQDGQCRRLILNMVDAPKPEFFVDEMIDEAMTFIAAGLATPDGKVLIHCNQGGSRAPSLALLYLRGRGDFEGNTFEEAEEQFLAVYPSYQPAAGIRAYVERRWNA